MSLYETLSPYEQWMVRSNFDTIRSTGVTVTEQTALLRANGYSRIAAAVKVGFDNELASPAEGERDGNQDT